MPNPTQKTMTVADVVAAIEPLAPLHLAEDWDQVGLQVGRWDDPASKGLLCIDFTPAVLDEAVKNKCDFVIAYHPPMFKPLARLTQGSGNHADWKQELLVESVRQGVAVYSPHTALDSVRGGFCDMLCDIIAGDLEFNALPLQTHTGRRDEYKVVVFVPEGDEENVRQAMTAAGAGGIGNYRECSFSTPGTGGFRPVKGATPAIGTVGKREEVAERRLEMLAPGNALPEVLHALRTAHPYEEPAFDIFKLEPEPIPPAQAHGTGRCVTLAEAITPDALAKRFADFPEAISKLGHRGVQQVKTVAVCPGAGGSLFETVDADAYVTGEMQHHQVLDLVQRGKVVLLLGHTASERPLLPRYREMIEATEAGQIDWPVSEADVTPWIQA